MPDLVLADISEFQGDIDWPAYAAATPAVIVRAHNGYRPDNYAAANLDGAQQCRWWGAYQYLTIDRDPADQARGFAATLGSRRPNALIVDIEEGTGDLRAAQHAWLEVLVGLGIDEWTYSGSFFARDHNLDTSGRFWLAAYQNNEPTYAHQLWQFSDARSFAGIAKPCDASVFHGSIDDLLALTTTTPEDLLAALNDEEQRRLLANTDKLLSLVNDNVGPAVGRIEVAEYAQAHATGGGSTSDAGLIALIKGLPDDFIAKLKATL